jgi:gliding motility-associated-like protein
VVTPVTCHGGEDGIISITGSGGNPPYTYTLNPGAVVSATGIFSGLGPGSFTVEINGTGGCPGYTADTIIFTDPPQLYFDSTEVSLINCHGSTDGSITVYATGGIGPLQYSIDDGSSYSDQGTITGLTASTYLTLVLDANGCMVRGDTVVLVDPPGMHIDVQSATDTVCFGDSSGMVTVTVSGGTLPLEYTLDSMNWQSSGTFTALPAGTYMVSIRDGNNCTTASDALIISHRPAILADITIIHSINGEPGAILVSSGGGTGSHEYSKNGPAGPFQADTAFTPLWPDDYVVTVRDEAACTYSETVTLEAIPPLMISVSSTNIDCYGDSAGTITLSSLNGTDTVTYSIHNDPNAMSSDSVFEDLPAGTYYILARDGDHRLFKDTVYITSPDPLIIVVDTLIQISCFGLTDGAIHTGVSGGVQPYLISWTTVAGGFSSSDTIITGLTADTYEMSVTDANFCGLKTGPLLIAESLLLEANIDSIKNISCYGSGDGAIYTTINGGTQPYEVLWTGPDSYRSSFTDITGLDTGNYRQVVTDAMGCTANNDPVAISEPDTLTVEIGNASDLNLRCYGDNDGRILVTTNGGTPDYKYYWSGPGGYSSTQKDISNLGGGDYYLLVYDANRCVASTGKVSVSEPQEIKQTATITAATCYLSTYDGSISLIIDGGVMPLTYLWSNGADNRDISGLNTGSYSVQITDADNCSVTAVYEVEALSSVRADAGRDTAVCPGEPLVLNGKGGDFYSWQPVEGLSDPNILNPVVVITAPVSYLLTVSDAGGCMDTASVNISLNPLLGIDAGNDLTTSIGQVIQLTATGGPFESYSWTPATGLDHPSDQSPTLTVTGEAIYYVTGTSILGCQETDSVRIFITSGLIIYSGFTPNDDGTNEYWDIDNTDLYPEMTVMVFNRWGRQIFFSKGYSDEQRWDGRYNGKYVPTGTYYYIIELGDDSAPISGTVTIIR